MLIFLNLLLTVISILAFGARMIEINYLNQNHILDLISDPLLMGIVFLMFLCASILVFSNKSFKTFRVPTISKVLTLISGVLFITYYGINFGSLIYYDIFILLGGIGLIIYSLSRDELSIKNLFYIIPTSVFIIGLSLQTIIFDVSSTNNNFYLFESLSSASILLLFLSLFRCINYPTSSSYPSLYFFGFSSFMLLNSAYLTSFIFSLLDGSYIISDLILSSGFIVLGFFGISCSISVSLAGKHILITGEEVDTIEIETSSIENTLEITEDASYKEDKDAAVLSLFSIKEEDIEDENEDAIEDTSPIEVNETSNESTFEDTNENTLSISGLFSNDTQLNKEDNKSCEEEIDNTSNFEEKSVLISSLFNESNNIPFKINSDILINEEPEKNPAIETLAPTEVIEELENNYNETPSENTVLISSLFKDEDTINSVLLNETEILEIEEELIKEKEKTLSISELFSNNIDSDDNMKEEIIEDITPLTSNSEDDEEITESNDAKNDAKNDEPIVDFSALFSSETLNTNSYTKDETLTLKNNTLDTLNDDTSENSDDNLSENERLVNFFASKLEENETPITDNNPSEELEKTPAILEEKPAEIVTPKGNKLLFKADKSVKKKSSSNRILFKKD